MKLEYLWGQLANFDQILYEASLRWWKGSIRFGKDWIKTLVSMATESFCWLIMGKTMSPPFLCCFWSDLFKLAGNEDRHNLGCVQISARSEYSLRCPWASEKISHRLIMGKWCPQASSFIFDRIFVKLAGYQDRHKMSDKFDSSRIGSVTSELYALEGELNFQ